MNSIIGVIIVLFVLGILFFVLGSCFCHFFGREESIEFAWLLGFVLFLGIFALLELPIELSGMAFHVLVYVELAVFAVLFVAGGAYCIRAYRSGGVRWQKPDRLTVVLFALILLQILYGMNNGIRINGYDTSYYNGHAINALYTDTIYQYDARTGAYVGSESYVHDCYPMLLAVLAKVFAMHPLVVENRVLACLEILFMNLIVYEIARRLTGGNREIANWTVGIHAAISILSYDFSETAEFYLWQRTAESKSMLANIYLPLVLLALVLLAKKLDDTCNWLILGSIVLAGVTMSISGIFILTAMVGVGLLSILMVQRKWNYLIRAVLCVLPGLAMGAIRILQ